MIFEICMYIVLLVRMYDFTWKTSKIIEWNVLGMEKKLYFLKKKKQYSAIIKKLTIVFEISFDI